jgi:nucleoside-diphosphate-sugar epimerase
MGRDAVFHTAALPGIWGDIRTYSEINITGTSNILVGCKRRGVPKLIYTSSPSVVFDMKDECGIDESTPYPRQYFNPYSHTKAIAEQEVLTQNNADGVLTCAIRPHLIWGPRDNHLIPRILDQARRRKLRIVGKGENKVDLTYIDNAAMAHLLAADAMQANRVAGKAYFVSDDNPVVLWDWINALLEQMKLPKVRGHIPAGLAFGIGRCLEKIYETFNKQSEPRMTRFLARALSCSHYYNISNAKRDFGYKPVIKNDEGVSRTVDYFLRGEAAIIQSR